MQTSADVIVTPKRPPKELKFRWDPDLAARIERIAEETGRTVNDAAELLMRWAVERQELEMERGGAHSAAKAERKKG